MLKYLAHISKRTKIVFAGSVFILIPTIILSYFGYEAVDGKAENLRSNHQTVVLYLKNRIEDEITKTEEDFRNTLLQEHLRLDRSDELQSILRRVGTRYLLTMYPFIMNASGGILSPMVRLQWNTGVGPTPKTDNLLLHDIVFAENAEYSGGDLREAIRLYQRALISTSSPRDQQIIWARIGRCYFKLNQYNDGIAAYRQLLTFSVNVFLVGSIPARVLALSQIADAYAALHLEKECERTAIELYSFLIDHPWDITDGSYMFYIDRTRELLNTYSIVELHLEDLVNREQAMRKEIQFLRSVQESIDREMITELTKPGMSNRSSQFVSPQLGHQLILVRYMLLPPVISGSVPAVLGYLVNLDYVLHAGIQNIVQTSIVGKGLIVAILDGSDHIVYKQEDISISHPLVLQEFSHVLPSWKLALYDRNGKTLEEIVAAEKRFYTLLFVGTILLMIVGVGITARSAAHEIQTMRIKSEFVSNVTHELKTPLTLIRMFSETLESGIVTHETKQKEFSGIIRRESERLTHLIDNVLDFSKIEKGKKRLTLTTIDLSDLIRATLDSYSYQIQHQGFQLETSIPDYTIPVRADKDALTQAILNLLSNAIKYSTETKYLSIKVEKNKQSVTISVTDHGFGIAKQDIPRVFDEFYRCSNDSTTTTRGTGLGLTIAKTIVEEHGGTINVQSQLGQGSTFIITLPIF